MRKALKEGGADRKGKDKEVLALINVILALRSTFLAETPQHPLTNSINPFLLALHYIVPSSIYADYI
jgi:hypothetical protein